MRSRKSLGAVWSLEGSNPSPSARHAGSGRNCPPRPSAAAVSMTGPPSTNGHRGSRAAHRARSAWRTTGARRLAAPAADGRPEGPRERRPVTPEVAGASPVAPVKDLQIAILCCRFRRQIGADYTGFILRRPENERNLAPKRVRGSHFKPNRALFMQARKAACDYTKRPEVNALSCGERHDRPPRAGDVDPL